MLECLFLHAIAMQGHACTCTYTNLQERSLQPKYMVAQLSELDMTSSAVTQKVRGDIHYQCGRSLVEGGAIEDAIKEFGEVIKHCPSNAMVSLSLSLSLSLSRIRFA